MHILFTRPLEDCSEMILKFQSLGNKVSHLPLLKIEKVKYEELNFSEFKGIISLQCRNDDKDVISILDMINDQKTSLRAQAERNVLKVLEGDCETAVGAHAVINGDEIILEVELFSLDGTQIFYEKKSSKIENAKLLGREVGQILKTKSNNSYKK